VTDCYWRVQINDADGNPGPFESGSRAHREPADTDTHRDGDQHADRDAHRQARTTDLFAARGAGVIRPRAYRPTPHRQLADGEEPSGGFSHLRLGCL